MMSFALWALLAVGLFAIYASDRIRGITHEIWDRYVLNILKLGWPYALIFAVYDTVSNGSLGRTIRTIVAGY